MDFVNTPIRFSAHIIVKIKEDIYCSWENALAWGVNAKNSLTNVTGFSPSQLVFGQSINLPNILKDRLSARITETKLVGENILPYMLHVRHLLLLNRLINLNGLYVKKHLRIL